MAKTGSKGSKKTGKRSSGASTSKQKKAKKVKDPNAPKRAKSAYMFWLLENRSRIAKPGMSVIDVSKAAGIEWGKVKDKSKYEKMASQDKQRYEAEKKNTRRNKIEEDRGQLVFFFLLFLLPLHVVFKLLILISHNFVVEPFF
ncbi:high mobility group protein 1 [Loa loa]|uniref:High mobility group protein 1 n=1 Tax=Loa loa TaxID=7209 RepID=A0A1S0THX9_LOALO|nr:high mobility group protein 1 [Loa loa]EFO14171.2 high mobility group protein 1 [Loa loa]